MRHHAATVIKLLGMSSAKHLIGRLQKDDSFHTYESAAYNVFRMQKIRKLINYEVSEYFDDKPYGSYVNDIRNENLERLTFPNNRFDVVINSDVLEHVGNLKQALSEIKRVLKPGGFHVFTIPVDYELPRTVERAKITDGKVEYLMEPVMHGDSIRREGVLAFRDFGSDVLDYMSIEGFECKEFRYHKDDKYITSVYYAQKKE
jgi:SAM-dependent methyltransferase